MTLYYQVQEGYQCLGADNLPIAEAGEIVALESDSSDLLTRREAGNTFKRSGGRKALVVVPKPQKAKKKKGSYKTREMSAKPTLDMTDEGATD
tara:strand:- start:705 stop:983 length:279 start_codon:yes stop_codon:yes gene_type:complete